MSFFKGNYYTPKEASEKLGVHWQTLRNWEKQGKIKTIRSPGGKRYYDINNFIDKIENNQEVLINNEEFHSAISLNEDLAKEKCCFEAYEKLKEKKREQKNELLND